MKYIDFPYVKTPPTFCAESPLFVQAALFVQSRFLPYTEGPLHPETVVSRHFDSELISCTLE
jgi:hypothetical protein